MTNSPEEQTPDPAEVPLTVTHAPATRLESGEILSTPEDHERYAAEWADLQRAGRDRWRD
jgi:hypothetical protein